MRSQRASAAGVPNHARFRELEPLAATSRPKRFLVSPSRFALGLPDTLPGTVPP